MLKTKNHFLAIAAGIILLMPHFSARAEGHGPGNGGADYVHNGKHYLLDLFEAGVEESPYVENVKIDESFRKLIQQKIGKFASPEVVNLTAMKATEIKSHFPLLSSVLKAIIINSQVFTPDGTLRDPYSEASPLTYKERDAATGKLKKVSLKRVAVRVDESIYLDLKLFNLFSDENKSALFLHEWISTILGEQKDSIDTRLVIGTLYMNGGSLEALRKVFLKYDMLGLITASPDENWYESKDHLTFINKFQFYFTRTHYTLIFQQNDETADILIPTRVDLSDKNYMANLEDICSYWWSSNKYITAYTKIKQYRAGTGLVDVKDKDISRFHEDNAGWFDHIFTCRNQMLTAIKTFRKDFTPIR